MFPHPIREPDGHSFGETGEMPIDAEDVESVKATHHWAMDLFNAGYYWEAHEAWEGIWHAFGRSGTEADFVKGLIKLAAAGVKAREGNAAGVQRHAKRACELFRLVGKNGGLRVKLLGLDPIRLAAESDRLMNEPASIVNEVASPVQRVMPFVLAFVSTP
jgi:hypothetical protein